MAVTDLTAAPAKGSKRAVLVRLAKYFLRYKWRVLTAFFLMLGSNLFALIGPWLSGLAIDAIALEGGVDFAAVSRCCLLMTIFYVIASALSYILSVLMIRLSQTIVRSMRQDVFDKLAFIRLPFQWQNFLRLFVYDFNLAMFINSNNAVVGVIKNSFVSF